jgi:hypothetical protein
MVMMILMAKIVIPAVSGAGAGVGDGMLKVDAALAILKTV